MTKSQIFLYFCLFFIGGIFIGSLVSVSQLFTLGFLISGIFLVAIFWNRKKTAVFGFCLLFMVLGIWREQTVEVGLLQVKNAGEEVNFTGIVAEEPKIGEKITKLAIKPEQDLSESSSRTILVTTNRYPEYRYGDKLEITGKLEAPSEDIDGFNYRDYLKKDGIYFVMSWPKIEVLGSGFGNPIMAAVFSFKNKFKESVQRFIAPPQVGILEALVFGDEGGISKDWKEKLNLTGTRHIVAVSGMNITIIASLILNFLLALGFWRRRAFYFSLFLIVLYILMIGAPPSAVRAGMMGAILIIAQYLGRISLASRAVALAAVLMLFQNPLLLKLDVGFQLSFLAVLGIIYLQPFFMKWLKKIPDPKIFPLRSVLAATLSAQVFTFPILIYNFGYVSPVSPVTNILIVPFLAVLTVLILIFGFTAMVFGPLGYILSWPVWLFLTYITSVIDFFSKAPKIW